MLERITITIEKELLKSVDSAVDGKTARNRSQAITSLLAKALGKKHTKALVLCGKPENALKKIGDETVLEKLLQHLKKNGFTEIILALNKDSQEVINLTRTLGSGLNFEFVWDDGKGTAFALEKAKNFLQETFLITYADVLYSELDLNDLMEFHKKNNGVCTMALAEVKKPLGFGVAKTMGSRIIDFEEKPNESDTNLVNAGVGFCEPEVLGYISEKTPSFEKNLLPLLAKQGKLMGYNYSGEWKHFGKIS